MKRLIIYGLLAFLALGSIFAVQHYLYDVRTDEYFDGKTLIGENNFESTILAYEQVFKKAVEYKVDVDEVKGLIHSALYDPSRRDIYRKHLIVEILPVYDSLKSVGITHMHFHFPDGTSFLRLHRPDMHGDSLNDFRPLLVQTETEHVITQGFENGRHLLAYRFIFPLYFKDEFIGSVELSVGMRQLIQYMNTIYGIGYSYILEKEKVFKDYSSVLMDNYEKFSISDKYIMEQCDACSAKATDACKLENIDSILLNSIKDRNKDRLKDAKAFSEINVDHGESILLTYLPVIDHDGHDLGYIISHSLVTDYFVIKDLYVLQFALFGLITIFVLSIFYVMDKGRSDAILTQQQLEMTVQDKVRELQDKEFFFAQQSKMATMGEMVASILHQWKQPLSSITMITDLLLFECASRKENKEIYDNLQHVKEQAFFMSQTGADFLNFMKPSKEKQVFNIADAIENVIKLFEFNFQKFSIGFECSFSPDSHESANVYGYRNEFKHVLLNLFNNARDAIVDIRERMVEADIDVSEFSGVITIDVFVDGDQVIIKISDTGGGINREVINRVFDKYYTTKDEKGSGIGLYMTKEMVEKSMGGSITVDNVLGGAEFTIKLPKAK